MGKANPEDGTANHVSGQSNKYLSQPAHALTADQVISELSTNLEGLSDSDAKSRLDEYGRNELGEGEGIQPWKILLRQVANAMTLVLILAMAVSFGIQSWIEGGVITAVIVLNITVGFFQEFQAEKTMDSLRSLSSPTAHAVRAGNTLTVPTAEIVPGDVIILKTGDTIPADIRLTEAVNFETDEALLTGESLPVQKDSQATFPADTGPGDRLNVAYSSSTVTKGRATGIAYATGMKTEIGLIAGALRGGDSKRRPVKRKPDGTAGPHRYAQAYALTTTDAFGRFLGVNIGTPLQKKLSRLAVLLFVIAVICAIIVLASNGLGSSENDFSGEQEVIIYAVATGLSMIPASLIVVLTITMAAGTKRMVKRHVIVRNLKSLEALGAVTDICSDKTGTLTQGKMVARKAWIPGRGTYSVQLSNEPFNPESGDVTFSSLTPKELESNEEKDESVSPSDEIKESANLEKFMKVASIANLASVHHTEEGWKARGDPTEIAIQVFAHRFKYGRDQFVSQQNSKYKELQELSFDSDVKKMSMIMEKVEDGSKHLFTKGAVERVIGSCTTTASKGDDPAEMTEEFRQEILTHMESLAGMGLRVLALASKPLDSGYQVDDKNPPDRNALENELMFHGLVGLYDPPRPESAESVRMCHEAGVAVHMLTGDHPATARAIAIEVGILPSRATIQRVSTDVADAMVMTAGQFDKLSDDEIDQMPLLPLVIARCAPNTKVRMIEALHRRKRFVAMTGDGVNDSPSLKRADVGIAMGEAGSDVAKDASDIVLTDDNFASILNAVEEGRRMFDNIQKFILHVLAENIAQACTLLIGLAFKDSRGISVFPLAPVEVLWIIMITSGMPDMGLGFEEKAPDIMSRPPVSLKRGVFSIELMLDMVVYGFWTAALCLAAFLLVVYGFGDGDLGENCNETYSPECDTVFRARATCFACLTWFALFLAWEMVNMRRSFFRMQPKSKKYFTQWMHDVWRNQFLFWAVVAGFVTMFPVIYIPVINDVVFKHVGISWEWGIVFVETALFFAGIESWKWGKRIYFRHQARKQSGGVTDLESKAFGQFLSAGNGGSGSDENDQPEKLEEKQQQ